jgi:hypothetical protein
MALNMINHGRAARDTVEARQSNAGATRTVAEQTVAEALGEIPTRFQFWRGATAKRYIHTVFPLVACPVLGRVNYILVRRNADGTRTLLRIGRTQSDCGTLNRAEVRRRAAQIGANEVHVHLIAETDRQRAIVEMDLQAGLFATLSPDGPSKLVH